LRTVSVTNASWKGEKRIWAMLLLLGSPGPPPGAPVGELLVMVVIVVVVVDIANSLTEQWFLEEIQREEIHGKPHSSRNAVHSPVPARLATYDCY
jgi:hypothetical protein